MLGREAGFPEQIAAQTRRTPTRTPFLPTPSRCPAGFRYTAGTGAQTELSASPLNPRRSLLRQDKSPPSQQVPGPPTSQRGARDGYLARTSRAADGALAGAGGLRSSSRRNHAIRAQHGCKMDSRRRLDPAPTPSSPRPGTSVRLPNRASALLRLPGLAFPR